MSIVARLYRALPLLVVLAALALVVYLAVSAVRSPNRAKEVLIKLFTALSAALTVVFCTFTAYAWLEGNTYVLEWFGIFALASALVFAVTRICRRVFIKHHPDYHFKARQPFRFPRFFS